LPPDLLAQTPELEGIKRNKVVTMKIPTEFAGGKMSLPDETCGDNAANESTINTDSVQLGPFAVGLFILK